MTHLTILHTNDFHNKLTPEKAEKIRRLKAESQNPLLLDCGDAIWAGNIYFRPNGEPVLELMNGAGYDAMTMGNREFHFMESGLRAKLGWAQFPVLCANIRTTRPNVDLPVLPYTTFSVEGKRVLVFGLTVPMITERMLVRKFSAYVFDHPLDAAASLVPELRSKADLLIAVTHIGLQMDRELAERVPGIDVIVGGHTHAKLSEPERVGGTAIVQAGWFAHFIGRTRVEFGGGQAKVSGELLEL
jgi:2',3'-cyclic-nucleotide 2'-phosphodiesterase (5'-nucleotidase family)